MVHEWRTGLCHAALSVRAGMTIDTAPRSVYQKEAESRVDSGNLQENKEIFRQIAG
jgi:hypothetical protein